MTQTVDLISSKGPSYGQLTVRPNGRIDTSGVTGVNADLRVRPFQAQGGVIRIREMVVDELKAEMGLEAPDTDLLTASRGGRVVTPSGMVLDGRLDDIDAPPVSTPAQDGDGDGKTNEIPLAIVDYFESYLLNSFEPAIGQVSTEAQLGRAIFTQIGCSSCHIPNLPIDVDRRIVDVDTSFDAVNGGPFNELFRDDHVAGGRAGRRARARAAAIAATGRRWLSRTQPLYRLHPPRRRPGVLRAQLRWLVADHVHDHAALGCGDDRALRS